MPESTTFFSLPPELRNIIYGYLVLDYKPRLTPRTRGRLSSACSLMRVCRQTKSEFSGQLYAQSTQIVAYARDYKFSHIVTFFNKLSAVESNVLKTKRCEVIVKLSHSPGPYCVRLHIPEGLSSFIHRITDPHKPGCLDIRWTFECMDWHGLASAVQEGLGDRLRGWRLLHPGSQVRRRVARIVGRAPRTRLMAVDLALMRAQREATA